MTLTEQQKWAVLTSNEIRHRYVANILSASPLIKAVVSEPKRRTPANCCENEEERVFLQNYFDTRTKSEETILSEGKHWGLRLGQDLIEIVSGTINNPDIPKKLLDLGVTNCLVFGTSWLREPWLQAFGNNMVNLHLGLSPYYRGAGTNFWALQEGKPELFGATIHLIDEGIDSGPILFHVRPDPEMSDDAHSLGNKTIAKAARALLLRVSEMPAMQPIPQWEVTDGREFKMKEFNVGFLFSMLDKIKHGLLREYTNSGADRARAVRLIREFEPVFGIASHKSDGSFVNLLS